MYTLLIVVYVLVSVSLIALVLFQQGKGADAGAAFGSGSSGTVFGARGSANFLTRATAWLATMFFILSLALAYVVHGRSAGTGSVIDSDGGAKSTVAAPAVPPPASSVASPATGAKPAEPDAPKVAEQPAQVPKAPQ